MSELIRTGHLIEEFLFNLHKAINTCAQIESALPPVIATVENWMKNPDSIDQTQLSLICGMLKLLVDQSEEGYNNLYDSLCILSEDLSSRH